MYSHLSSKEKRRRLALARKRALLWSVQEQTKAALKKTPSKKPATSTSTVLHRTHRESLPSLSNTYYTPIEIAEDHTNTVKALQKTLKDLHEQRQALDITIDVLQSRLAFLTLSDQKPQAKR